MTPNLAPSAHIHKIDYPNLQNCEIHYRAKQLGNIYKVTKQLSLKGLWKFVRNGSKHKTEKDLVNPYIENGDIDQITPFNKSIVDLRKVFITLNSLILVKKDEKNLILSYTSPSLSQKFLDSHAGNVEKLGLWYCGEDLKLPEMRKCIHFTCQMGTVLNLQVSIKTLVHKYHMYGEKR